MEWLIDIIKEWVEKKVYATEAWVLEWITPYTVTGDITPDVTCTYFKAGTHSNKPYYRSQDGAWFIWWWYQGWWYIGTEVGRETPYTWWKYGPGIEGEYTPLYGATGTPIVTVGRKFLCASFVDRGDPAAADWTEATLTKDGAWHDLDCSAIVPAGAKAILFGMSLQNDRVGQVFSMRKKTNFNAINVFMQRTQVSWTFIDEDGVVPCDNNRFVQYNADTLGWANIKLAVKGWWF